MKRHLLSWIMLAALVSGWQVAQAEVLLLQGATIHTVAGREYANGSVLIRDGRITEVSGFIHAPDAEVVDLNGLHLYPGLIALGTRLGLVEINAVRASVDTSEVGQFTPDVESWIAVNPDSELLPVARANGITFFQPTPAGGTVAGQSALMRSDGWTYEEMLFLAPVALHVYWPGMRLDTTPKEEAHDPAKWKSLQDQAKERASRLRELTDFFQQAKAYSKAKIALRDSGSDALAPVPAWQSTLLYVNGLLPVMVHANEPAQIEAAVQWAITNDLKMILVGGREAWRTADLLATNQIPVVFQGTFSLPLQDTDAVDAQFRAPAILHKAGVKLAFSLSSAGFEPAMIRNLPYEAATAVAYGLPPEEALKALTLHPAEILGVDGQLGSIEAGKEATLVAADGDILDIRSNVHRVWIAGREVSVESRHTRLYEKYRRRPRTPQ